MKKAIIPAVLVKNLPDLEFFLGRASQVSSFVQIDICDGEYVKSKTWPFTLTSKTEFLESFQKPKDLFLPFWESLEYSTDLMCANPLQLINPLFEYGFSEIIFHFGSLQNEFEKKKDIYKSFFEYLEKVFSDCQKSEIKVQIAISLKDNFSELLEVLNLFKDKISGVQVMGIENIGFQRQVFSTKSLDIIKNIRQNFANINISVDGGINLETILLCKESGANFFVVGSALDLENDDYIFNYREFVNSIK